MYQGELLILTSLISPTFLIKNIRKDNNITLIRLPKIKFDKAIIETYKNLENLILKVAKDQDYTEEFDFVTDFYGSDFNKDSLKSELETFQASFN